MEHNIPSLFLTSLSVNDIKFLFRSEIESYFASNPVAALPQPVENKKPLNIEQASSFLGIAKNTIYGKINEIPHSKKGKMLVFFEDELLQYLKSGKQKTIAEINQDAEEHLEAMGEQRRKK